ASQATAGAWSARENSWNGRRNRSNINDLCGVSRIAINPESRPFSGRNSPHLPLRARIPGRGILTKFQ
ncbi:MAG: hypothetical protein J4F48_11875, partial [Nitrospinae bacterium]|nr:hypothetical protein [Nitrospinota bacterium]